MVKNEVKVEEEKGLETITIRMDLENSQIKLKNRKMEEKTEKKEKTMEISRLNGEKWTERIEDVVKE